MTKDEAIELLKRAKPILATEELQTAIDIAIEELKPRGIYECFNCLCKSVVWDNDFTYEDFGMDGEGIVHVCHCASCGAEILYFITTEVEE